MTKQTYNAHQAWIAHTVAFLFISFSISCGTSPTSDFTETVDWASKITVQIGNDRDSMTGNSPPMGKQIRIGSGFLIGNGSKVLTNRHVVEGMDVLWIRLPNGQITSGSIERLSDDQDLALIRILEKSEPSLSVTWAENPKLGTAVLATGYTKYGTFSVVSGIVSGQGVENLGLAKKESYLQTDMELARGFSGGPLMNHQGEIIGINTATVPRLPNMTFAIPSHLIREFLKSP